MKNAALTEAKIRAARFGISPVNPKTGKPLASLTDGRGLYLKLMPSGAHSFRFDFVSPDNGKRQTLVIGSWPDVSLEQARRRAQDARNMLAEENPRCPVTVKKGAKEARKEAQVIAQKVAKGEDLPGSLKAVALDFFATKWKDEAPEGWLNKWSPGHAQAWRQRMEAHVFPKLGARPITSIQLEELIEVLHAVPSKHVAFSLRGFVIDIFKRARKAKLLTVNVALELKDKDDEKIGKAPKTNPRPAQTTPGGFARVIKAVAEYRKTDHRDCLLLAALLWQRPANMAGMKWADLELDGNTDWFVRKLDLDFTGPVWVIPAAEMKRDVEGKLNGKPHIVPLPAQAIAILRARMAQRDPLDAYVFPSQGKGNSKFDGPVNYDTIGHSLNEMGFKDMQCMHGFRASGPTIMGDVFRVPKDLTEMQLAHSNGLATGVSYQRGIRLEERADMLQTWGTYLDGLKSGAVVALKLAA